MKLRLEHPAIGEQIVELPERALLVGREGGDAELLLPWDPRISRRHVRFWEADGRVYFEDLHSRNGTWLDRARTHGAQPLSVGAVLVVGETFFSIVPESIRAPEPAPAPEPAVPAKPIDPALEAMMSAYLQSSDLDPADVAADVEARASSAPRDQPAPLPSDALVPEPAAPERRAAPAVLVPEPPAAPPVVEPKAPRADPSKRMQRVHPRFTARDRVGVRLAGRGELKDFMTENISRGGLFVSTDTPPARGSLVEVVIHTPDGELALRASVVHVLDPVQAGIVNQPPGVGLEFVDVTSAQRDAINRYVDGVVEKLAFAQAAAPAAVKPAAAPNLERTLQRAKDLIAFAEANDLYRALDLTPKSSSTEINNRVKELSGALASAEASATPPQLARLKAAEKVLERVSALLATPNRRAEYDFKRGDVRYEERMAEAKSRRGLSVQELRAVWGVAFPDRVERARELAHLAFEARKMRDIVGALRSGMAAIDLDPFHVELRKTVAAWKEMATPPEAAASNAPLNIPIPKAHPASPSPSKSKAK